MSRFTTLAEWLAWQETLHPATIELGLERVSVVWQRLFTDKFPASVITVAGTNGKGSTVAMLAAIYSAAGYQVAAYTSPHLLRYNERIVINGKSVTDEELCHAFAAIDTARGEISLTYFEFGTLAALWLFTKVPLDIVILEVGMGGRLDAVNIIDADVAVITAIDLDHQEWLGHDREQIGLEKAGIMRPHHPVVCSDSDLPRSVSDVAKQLETPLYRVHQEFDYRVDGGQWQWWTSTSPRMALPRPAMAGDHQFQNAAGVLMAVHLLQARFPVSLSQVREGLLNARVAGRFEILPGDITTILDVAHNPAGVQVLADTLAQQPSRCGRTIAVFTALADKDIAAMLNPIVQTFDAWYIAPANSPRRRDNANMTTALQDAGCLAAIHCADNIQAAYQLARHDAQRGDWIVVFGSFYAVADVLAVRV